MSLSDAYVRVVCDSDYHCPTEDEIELTALAGRGQYDMRNVASRLERDQWVTKGDRHYCADCWREMQEAGNTK
jgi:hypothetical protein